MRLRIAAALGLAAGLIAAPAFAADTAAPPAAPPAAAPAEPMAKPAPMMHHGMPMHHTMMHAMAKPDSEHMTIEQLNDMSLQAAKKGTNFTPPPGK